ERERERERDASSVIIKTKFLLCQNDGVFFYASGFVVSIFHGCSQIQANYKYPLREQPVSFLLWRIGVSCLFVSFLIDYKNLYTNFKISWLGIQCRVELLYRCRSNTGQCKELPVSQLSYASGCRDCTLMFVSVNSYSSTAIITEDGWKPHVSTTNRIKIITQNINNKKVSDLKNNNNEKENFIIDRDILCRCY
ncbi:MAG: hypothetical protein QM653_09210, partial [Dysgonomonas sp.]|uniref:hypothetical protein n=1 Tax=Dysgonomonas sp. TaxID=1891233 RepID=UPI0039E48C93